MSATGLTIASIDQGTATLVAAIVAALSSLLTLVPKLVEQWRLRAQRRERQRRLISELSEGKPMRSYAWLSVRLGMSQDAIEAMIIDIPAHGVMMSDDSGNRIKGVALDARHQAGS